MIKHTNRKVSFSFVDWAISHWGIVAFVIAFISACAIFPFKLQANEKRVDKLEQSHEKLIEQTTAIYKWVERKETEEELQEAFDKEQEEKAPHGFRWDKTAGKDGKGDYVLYKDDPRLKKK